jgi:hypothetical protein
MEKPWSGRGLPGSLPITLPVNEASQGAGLSVIVDPPEAIHRSPHDVAEVIVATVETLVDDTAVASGPMSTQPDRRSRCR